MNLLKIREYLENNEEMVIAKIVETMKEAEGFDSSWRTELLIDEDLEPWTTGIMSQNSFKASVWNGDAFVIGSGDGWSVGASGYDYNFEETLKYQDNYSEIETAFESQDEDSVDYEYDFYNFVKENYTEVIEKMDSDHRDYLISEFEETASNQYSEALERLDIAIANAEEKEDNEKWVAEQRKLEQE